MPWYSSIFQCLGIREQRDRDQSATQPGSKASRDSDVLTDFIGGVPPFKEKVKLKPAIDYVNGVKGLTAQKEPIDLDSDCLSDRSTVVGVEDLTAQKEPIDSDCLSDRSTVVGVEDLTAEKEPIDSDCLSDRSTVVESIDTVTPGNYDDLQFSGSTNAFLDESSGKLAAIFSWTSLIYLDSHELVKVIPEPEKKVGLVEAIFNYYGTLVPVFSPSQYAEQRLASRHSNTLQRLPPAPPPTPCNWICEDFEAFAAWAQHPPPYARYLPFPEPESEIEGSHFI